MQVPQAIWLTRLPSRSSIKGSLSRDQAFELHGSPTLATLHPHARVSDPQHNRSSQRDHLVARSQKILGKPGLALQGCLLHEPNENKQIMKIDYWHKFEHGGIYHIYNKTISGRLLFKEHNDYQRFLTKFLDYFGPYILLYAYCLIPNHFHFLFKVRKINNIDRNILKFEQTKQAELFLNNQSSVNKLLQDQMRRFFSSISLYLNRKYQIKGSLFLERTKRLVVTSEEDTINKLCYVHHNPIHHGLVSEYADWKYSSYNDYIARKQRVAWQDVFSLLETQNTKNGEPEFFKVHDLFKRDYDGI
ncbi:hypothetical protein [Membranihabitans maritimus]|uniref:hypothetical protein n=1 Tax=Membranihabitans maritimus TaxID=2904244 RepID=UPI001F2623D1|nr:hypothetical protein [Membranihabitans maritimus]